MGVSGLFQIKEDSLSEEAGDSFTKELLLSLLLTAASNFGARVLADRIETLYDRSVFILL